MKYHYLLASAFILLLTGCAMQQDMNQLDESVTDTHQRIEELARKIHEVEKNEQNLRTQFAELRAVFDSFREEMQAINGMLEQDGYDLMIQKRDFEEWKDRREIADRNIAEVKKRIVRVERYLDFKPYEDTAEDGAEGGTERPQDKDDLLADAAIEDGEKDSGKKDKDKFPEQELYLSAKETFDKREYKKSRKMFLNLLKKHPQSENADNAQFWIGETYYREAWYEKAILEYQKVVENHPNGNKVPAALLKQGLSFNYIGDKKSAKTVLKELIAKFPDSNEAIIAVKKLEGI